MFWSMDSYLSTDSCWAEHSSHSWISWRDAVGGGGFWGSKFCKSWIMLGVDDDDDDVWLLLILIGLLCLL